MPVNWSWLKYTGISHALEIRGGFSHVREVEAISRAKIHEASSQSNRNKNNRERV